MVGAAYASVPLYRLFCQVTGFDGTPRIATKPSATVLDKTVTIRFDGNVTPGLPWHFEPVQNTMEVKIGENNLAFFRATNTSDQPVRGTAIYNVFPEIAAVYFNKLQCFCFTEQLLQPGETDGVSGELLRRSADRERQGRARRSRISRCPIHSTLCRRQNRGSPRNAPAPPVSISYHDAPPGARRDEEH